MAAGDGKRVERILHDVTGEVVGVLQLRAWQAITSATPVDTGFARSSVTPSIGSPLTVGLERPTVRATAEQQAAKAFAENQERAGNIASRYKLAMGRVFIVAQAAYFVFLNAGSSAQAPAMFVERAVIKAVLSLRNFKPRSA